MEDWDAVQEAMSGAVAPPEEGTTARLGDDDLVYIESAAGHLIAVMSPVVYRLLRAAGEEHA